MLIDMISFRHVLIGMTESILNSGNKLWGGGTPGKFIWVDVTFKSFGEVLLVPV